MVGLETVEQRLTDTERSLLHKCEQQIFTGFMFVGNALRDIRDQRLFREYGTWDNYCRTRWEYSSNRADQMISAVAKSDHIFKATGVRLENERQVRALNSVELENRPIVIKTAKALSDSTGKPLTGGMIERVASVFEQAKTGYLDTGSGESTPLTAALVLEEYEAMRRHQEHLRAGSANREQYAALPSVATSNTEAVTVIDVTVYPDDAGRTAKVLVDVMGKDAAYNLMLALTEQFGG